MLTLDVPSGWWSNRLAAGIVNVLFAIAQWSLGVFRLTQTRHFGRVIIQWTAVLILFFTDTRAASSCVIVHKVWAASVLGEKVNVN